MEIEEIKTALKNLTANERRKVALYILELEKEQVQKKYGRQIAEDLDDVSNAVQEAMEKLKKFVNKR